MQIGIIGLPNVGKSTLFNALLKKQVALAANYPFATIEPNIGIVDVPDGRLVKLVEIVKLEHGGRMGDREVPQKIIPAVVKFVDIAGLVKGASEGEGLGNKFLSHVREVDALVHVIRAFEDENIIRAGAVSPEDDRLVIETELLLADLAVLEKIVAVGGRSKDKNQRLYEKIYAELGKGISASQIDLSEDELKEIKSLNLLTLKPIIYVYNVSEDSLAEGKNEVMDNNIVRLSAKIEEEISILSETEQAEYLEGLGIGVSGLDKVIKRGYDILGLQTFFTAGPKEVRAWTIKKGSKAPQAAGVIHTDFERGFISAETCGFTDYVEVKGWKNAKEKGLVRIEGKDYEMKDGDVVEFRFNV